MSKTEAKVKMLPESSATAKDAAQLLGVHIHQIGKSIVCGNDSDTVVAIICGDQRVDMSALSRELQINDIKSLKANEVRERVGFVIGGVSPFALPNKTIIVIDSSLHNLPKCYVAAGHPKAVVQTSGKEIVDLTNSRIVSICNG